VSNKNQNKTTTTICFEVCLDKKEADSVLDDACISVIGVVALFVLAFVGAINEQISPLSLPVFLSNKGGALAKSFLSFRNHKKNLCFGSWVGAGGKNQNNCVLLHFYLF
jgi:hypothetical protein